jgi:cobalamin synthase
MESEPISPNPVKATTTVEQDLHTSAARLNDAMWENTQRQIALMVVGSSILYALITIFYTPKIEATTVFFASSFSLIIGFYFGRTNHQRLGGISDNK